ncbi:ash family protein [Escherichia coli]|nr:ash family protein [Escherichia coli]HBE6178480.1 ash family protein [Escherichia coli]HBE6186549.1 ash family protein [Escherichia coli]
MPFLQKNRLPCRNQSGYISAAPHKTGAGFRSLLINKAHNRASGFFVRTALPHIFSHQNYGGAYGADFGRAGFSLLTGTANLVRLATHSFAALDGEYSKLTNKEATLWQTANSTALSRSVVTSRLKSIADSPALHTSPLSCNPTHCTDSTALFQPTTAPLYSAIWRKTSCLFRISSSSKTNSINSCSGPFLHLAAGGLRTSVTRGLPQ